MEGTDQNSLMYMCKQIFKRKVLYVPERVTSFCGSPNFETITAIGCILEVKELNFLSFSISKLTSPSLRKKFSLFHDNQTERTNRKTLRIPAMT